MKQNKMTQRTICGAIQHTVLNYMYFSEKQFYQIAFSCSHMVGHGHTQPDIIAHSRTWSNIIAHHRTDILLKKLPYMVEHGHTKFILTAHSRTDDRTWSHTVAQKILSCQDGLPSKNWVLYFSSAQINNKISTLFLLLVCNIFGYAKKSRDFFGQTNKLKLGFFGYNYIKYEPLSDRPPHH